MTLHSEKARLIELLTETNDLEMIRQIKALFDFRSSSWFEELPADIKNAVKTGLEESSRGEGISHAEARREYEKWLGK